MQQTIVIEQRQIRRSVLILNDQHRFGANARFLGLAHNQLTKFICANRRNQGGIGSQTGQIFGDIAGHTANTNRQATGI